jgi:hypothetical protein
MATKMLREREREGEVLGVTEGQLELTRGLLLCISSFGGTTSSVRKQRLDWDQGKKLKRKRAAALHGIYRRRAAAYT